MQISMKAARVNAGLSQRELAKSLGVTYQTVSNWERGKSMPKINAFQKFCSLVGVMPEHIFFPCQLTFTKERDADNE